MIYFKNLTWKISSFRHYFSQYIVKNQSKSWAGLFQELLKFKYSEKAIKIEQKSQLCSLNLLGNIKSDLIIFVFKVFLRIYSVDHQWHRELIHTFKIESIHTLLLSRSISFDWVDPSRWKGMDRLNSKGMDQPKTSLTVYTV